MARTPYASIEFEEDLVARDKKAAENLVVRGFLERIGFTKYALTNERDQEKPDAIVVLNGESQKSRLAIELRTLSNDEADRGSAMRRFRSTWKGLMAKVLQRIASQVSTPVPYCVVEFLKPSYDCLNICNIQDLENEMVKAGTMLRVETSLEFPIENMPELNRLVRRIKVRDPDGQGLLWWPSHMQAGRVESLETAVASAINEKTEKAQKYAWQGVRHRWLLLVAEAHGTTDLIGRPMDYALDSIK